MKTNQPIPPEEADAAKQETSGGRAPRLVVPLLKMPRQNSARWMELGSCLDTILSQIDYPAIHQGYCRRKVTTMDDALSQIIRSAQRAQSIIRHNAKHIHPEPEANQ